MGYIVFEYPLTAEKRPFKKRRQISAPQDAARGEVDDAVVAMDVNPICNLAQIYGATVSQVDLPGAAVNPDVKDWVGQGVLTPPFDEELELFFRGHISMDEWRTVVSPQGIQNRFN